MIWPSPAANAPVGTVELGHAVFRKIPLASATADVKFEKQKILLKSRGSVLNQTFEFTSETAPFEPGGLISENRFKIPKQSIAGLEPLYPLFPDIEPWKCEGDLELSAAYHIYPQKSGGSAEIYWTDGKVKNQDLQLDVEGINFNFALPNLPVMESQANQNLSFRKASYQQIHTENGDIQFRMESPKVWYIENLNLKWCDGKIRLASTKIAPEEQKLAAVLHCDRIQLTRFLSQVGVGDLKGNGSISGMLPIRLEQNKIIFQDGFLYSTPGEQGRILGNISDELWHNVNQATGGTVNAELDLAKDALKDFTYSWAKIYLESEENRDALHLKLQFDGKPEQLLYYEFNEQKQGFQKAKVPYRFQGIQLDVNITLPINNTLKVLNSLSSAFNRQ